MEPPTQKPTDNPARAHILTTQSGVKGTNQEANAPPTKNTEDSSILSWIVVTSVHSQEW